MNVIVIPDIHGRKFWRKAIPWADSMPIIFLGDYLDPYFREEGIDSEEAYDQLDEILDFKKKYPEMITLLLGNHDLHYLSSAMGGCRYDHRLAYQNKALLWSNLPLFDIGYSIVSKERQYLFTHAGVDARWYWEHFPYVNDISADEIAKQLNDVFHADASRDAIMDALSETSLLRGGSHPFGSPIWADRHEHRTDAFEFGTIYQIFGHTLAHGPVITPFWACLDCKRGFRLDIESGLISEL